MRAVLALALKDLLLLRRDRAGAFFTLVFPVAFAVLFGLIFSGTTGTPTGVRVLVVDEDGSAASAAFMERLTRNESLRIEVIGDAQVGAGAVRRGQRAAMLVLPAGFGESVSSPTRLFGGGGGDEGLVRGVVDPGQRFTTGLLQGAVTAALFETVSGAMGEAEGVRRAAADGRAMVASAEPGTINLPMRLALRGVFDQLDVMASEMEAAHARGDGGDAPSGDGTGAGPGSGFGNGLGVRFEEVAVARSGPRSSFDLTIPQGNAWGLMACVIGFGMSLVTERTRGTMTRLLVAPVSSSQVLAGKAVACFATACFVQTVLILVGVAFFGVRVGSVGLLAAGFVAASFAFTGIMMTLSAVGRTEGGSEGFGRAVLLVLALFGGGGVPLAFMPEWMRQVAGVSPFKWAILAVENAVWRGASAAEAVVPLVALAGFGVAGFVLGVWLFRRSLRR
ncbi:MAG: ABC transporter permease [Phycisphaerales bacterium]|nr:MAG: ABC transporter permease [Phycisphaerales bacterium]